MWEERLSSFWKGVELVTRRRFKKSSSMVTVVSSSSLVALNPLMAAPSLPLDVLSSSMADPSSPPDVPRLPTAGPSLPTVALEFVSCRSELVHGGSKLISCCYFGFVVGERVWSRCGGHELAIGGVELGFCFMFVSS